MYLSCIYAVKNTKGTIEMNIENSHFHCHDTLGAGPFYACIISLSSKPSRLPVVTGNKSPPFTHQLGLCNLALNSMDCQGTGNDMFSSCYTFFQVRCLHSSKRTSYGVTHKDRHKHQMNSMKEWVLKLSKTCLLVLMVEKVATGLSISMLIGDAWS